MRFATALTVMFVVASAIDLESTLDTDSNNEVETVANTQINAKQEDVSTDTPANASADTASADTSADTASTDASTVNDGANLTVNTPDAAPAVEAPNLTVNTPDAAPAVEAPYPGYYDNPGYMPQDYEASSQYETLPSADFNKHVYEFNESKPIWDQQDYNERVKVEAEILVALEALKTSAMYLGIDVREVEDFVRGQYLGENYDIVKSEIEATFSSIMHSLDGIHLQQDKCRYAEDDLAEERDMLILYCQQFAFAPTMVPQCGKLLSCRGRNIAYDYIFDGSVSPSNYDSHSSSFDNHYDDLPLHSSDHDHSSYGPTSVPVSDPYLGNTYVSQPIVSDPYMIDANLAQPNFGSIDANYYGPDAGVRSTSTTDPSLSMLPPPTFSTTTLPPPTFAATTLPPPTFAADSKSGQDHDLSGNHNMEYMPELATTEMTPEQTLSSHGIHLPAVGGNVKVDPSLNPELAAAAVNQDEAVIVHEGQAFLAPINAIDPDCVELACNEEGCALIKDDGNPDNDIHVQPTAAATSNDPAFNDDWVSF